MTGEVISPGQVSRFIGGLTDGESTGGRGGGKGGAHLPVYEQHMFTAGRHKIYSLIELKLQSTSKFRFSKVRDQQGNRSDLSIIINRFSSKSLEICQQQ